MTIQLSALGHTIVASRGDDLDGMKIANLVVDGNEMTLDNISVVGDTLTGSVSVMWITASVVMVAKDHEVDVTISHSWLADGQHVISLDATHVTAVRKFIQEFA